MGFIFKTIKSRLIILYIMLVFIVMILSGTIILIRLQNNTISEWEEDLVEAKEEIIVNVIETSEKDPSEYNDKIDKLYKGNSISDVKDLQIYILDSKGSIFATLENTNIEKTEVIVSALTGNSEFKYNGQTLGIDSKNNKKIRWVEYAAPYKDSAGNIEFVIYLKMNSENLTKNIYITASTFLISSAVSLVVAAFIAVLFSSTLTNPILNLTNKAKELAKGNFSFDIPVSSNDEIGELTTTFNYMASKLRDTIANTEKEKNKLEVLLYNMTDGVLAFDNNKELVHANSISLELLEISLEDIKDLNKLDKKFDIDLEKFYKSTNDKNNEFTFQIGEKYLTAVITSYSSNKDEIDGIIIVIQDVTKLKKLDNMRKEFVANVSHEIRTPLTTIKGYAEMLIDGEIENKENAISFLEIIEKETDKMTVLTQDLLELSHFDNKQFKISLSELNLISLVRETIAQNKILAKNKNQEIIFNSKKENINIIADNGRILQVITNILTNAIKYSVDEGIININITDDENFIYLSIKDMGMGIPPEDIPHIFERFYRVDKARSRAMGGTGLGLSIAKEIMELHEGNIILESEVNTGTTFTLIFNKNFGLKSDEIISAFS